MKQNIRKWHIWISVALGVPLLLVGLTTFFIAHEKQLGTKEIIIPLQTQSDDATELRSIATVGHEHWLGTKQGVFRLNGAEAVAISGTPTDEIRSMLPIKGAVLMAGKKGLWRYENGAAVRLYKGDCWHVAANGSEGYTAACKDAGLMVSEDGERWQPRLIQFNSPADGSVKNGTALSKIIMDLHTGRLFFGKRYDWIWIDLLGIACVGLGVTGFTMWFRSRRRKKQGRNCIPMGQPRH